jgi:hypothetical protein
MRRTWILSAAILLLTSISIACADEESGDSDTEPFPALVPLEKPDGPLSAAVERLYDVWNPHEDRGNELFSNFRYSRLDGFDYDGWISRRDPSKIIRIDGTYYVWYTYRDTIAPPSGAQNATDEIPSTDWDLSDIWYATSEDGFTWEEQGPAVVRPPHGEYGWRSVTTTDILIWEGKYYLYFQGFNEAPGTRGDRAAVSVAQADSPEGPWQLIGRPVIDFGGPNDWDANAIHDPYPVVFKGKIHVYYKGSPGLNGANGTIVRAQGVAIADDPLGPFTKSPLNPVINSGHETSVFPWQDGLAAIISLDGPEKNTIQFTRDGVNFEVAAMIQVPPISPGPFIPDAYANTGDGRGITWGLCHIDAYREGGTKYTQLARFDCDLSLDVDRPIFKKNNLRFTEGTYFEQRVALPEYLRNQIERERRKTDHDTISYGEGTKSVVDTEVEEEANQDVMKASDVGPFPGVMPLEKPNRPLSSAWARMWDRWNPHEDRGNELYSNFKYSHLEGIPRKENVSRRDPTKVLMIDETYYVWYTHRQTTSPPVGQNGATDLIPATDWDLAEIWYATSEDGFTWEEQGRAVTRPASGHGSRSICTPGVLAWRDKYYLYFQAYGEVTSGTVYCPVRAAWSDSPNGPWTHVEEPVIWPSPEGSWGNIKVNDPCPIVYDEQIYIYFKGAPIERGDEYVLRMQGVAIADDPLGPFKHSPLNPVINGGHETCMWPWRGGVAALIALDGPEKNTIQFAPDGLNFEVVSNIQVPPIAPGPFVPDAYASSGAGRGFTWGLCHINPDGGGATSESILARFDCDLSLDVDRPILKRNNLRFEAETYFQPRIALPGMLRAEIMREREGVDRDTMIR